ncbi:hypothetical protein DXG01_002939 [Tephrocybe rancida]|nr:hypothetical protein DXG01_002939 [Tephrocybe rancida]
MPSSLRRLALTEIPPFSLPAHTFANITCLKMRFKPRKTILPLGTHSFQLTMSKLCRILDQTPLLEELSLSNTVPYFDSFLPEDGVNVNPFITIRTRVQLPYLKKFKWSYPYPGEIHWLITFFDIPVLEKLDIWTEEHPTKGRCHDTQWHTLGPQYDLISQTVSRRKSMTLPSLLDLILQCAGENALISLRKVDVPSLQTLEIANTDPLARTEGNLLPDLPRLDSLLRNPYLPHLETVTLSRFDISSVHDKDHSFLGYMPRLTSLSLDACTNVRSLMASLEENFIASEYAQGDPRKRRRVKVCPRLEAVSFWGCEDLNYNDVRMVVSARNGHGCDADRVLECSGQKVQRKIKPLRKARRARLLKGAVERDLGVQAIPVVDDVFLNSTGIIYLRFDGCAQVLRKDAIALSQLGVVDVVYNE